MNLPEIPFSPYLYTEWADPATRVSNTMFTESQLKAYGEACYAKAIEDAAKVADVTPPQPFRPSIEAAWAIRALLKESL